MDVITPKVGEPTDVSGRRELRVVEDVEDLGAELEAPNFFDSAMSAFQRPGPNSVVRAALPSTPTAGATKQLVSNHFCIVGLSSSPSHTRLGRLPNAVPDWLLDMLIPSG